MTTKNIATWMDVLPKLGQRGRIDRNWATNSRSHISMIEHPLAAIRVRDMGTGIPIVFATDPPNVIEHYDEWFDKLSPSYRVICLEFPGFGFSEAKIGFSFDLEGTTDILEFVFTHLGIQNAVLIFPCVTGFVALRLAARRKDMIARLFLPQTPSFPEIPLWIKRIDPRGLLTKPFLGQFLLSTKRYGVAKNWYRTSLGEKTQVSQYFSITKTAFDHGACFCLASVFQQWMKPPSLTLERIEQPVVIPWGTLDRSYPSTDPDSLQSWFLPHAKTLRFEDAGHFPELESSERFLEEIIKGL